jgi:glucan 1,3-beta-glucosidase
MNHKLRRSALTFYPRSKCRHISTYYLSSNFRHSYFQAYTFVRLASGTGAGNGPIISFHDGFAGATKWAGFLPGADRISLDLHPYLAFSTQTSSPMSALVSDPCTSWGSMINQSMSAFGLTAAGEFSNAINDCGLYVNGVGLGTRYEGTYPGYTTKVGDCSPWEDYSTWSQSQKDSTKQFAMSSMDALQVSRFASTHPEQSVNHPG